MAEAEKPGLWVLQDNEVLLRGTLCKACGSLQFPPQPYGCEACGADASLLEDHVFSSRGTLRTYTTVHLDQKLETPFQVAEVQTEASQLVRGRLECSEATSGVMLEGEIRDIDGEARFVFVPVREGGN